jgi:acyl transferase domain-containing protein
MKAEDITAVFLKHLSDAVRDGDPIRTVIRGSATTSDGQTPGIASPSAEAQTTAIYAAYINAGIMDLTLTSYLEFHALALRYEQLEYDIYSSLVDSVYFSEGLQRSEGRFICILPSKE